MSSGSKSSLPKPPAPSGPTAPAPKDPQPTVDRIDELARRIRSGDILLPKFQREFVWDRSQVLELLDSIVRNYPIGSILLWQSRQELRSENRIADLEIKLPKPDYPVNYLLDGQQRLSTICGALYWEGSNPQSVWNIAYDLRERRFLHLEKLDDPPQHQVRMNKLSEASIFYKYVATLDSLSAADKDILKGNADQLFNRLKDYKIAVVTLGDMSIQDVAPIFERINSTGTQLTIVDLMRAATWSQEFDLIEAIDNVREALAAKNFGGLDRKVVLRTMSAAAGGGFSSGSIDDLRKLDAAKLKSAAGEAETVYRKVVDFLSTQIKIPGDAVIPYVNQVVVLSEMFRKIPDPSAEQYARIREWFWRTAISGYFSGWNTGMMAADQKAVEGFAVGKTKTIEVDASKPRPEIWSGRTFRTNNAHAKALAIVLTYHKPVDLLTGQEIDVKGALSWTNSKEFHHFFPRGYLQKKEVPPSKINALANIVLMSSASNKAISDRAPSDYLKDVQKAAGSRLNAWLESHMIPPDAFEAARADDFELFLVRRRDAIHRQVLLLAGWGGSGPNEGSAGSS
jgi:hypothetical protein